MKKIYCFVGFFLVILFSACGGGSAFPMGKKYWTDEDYRLVNQEITTLKYNDKELPNLENPRTEAIFRKIVDTTNVSVVANDNQLGIKYRSEFTGNLFSQYREIESAYEILDRSDKYKYPVELIEISKFGLTLQAYYFDIGDEHIRKNSDNPESSEVVNMIKRNENVVIRNYNIYLDLINYEDRFNQQALISYSEGLKYFPRLVNNVAPDGDYSEMLVKVQNMLKKSKNPLTIAELQNIESLITSKQSQPNSK